MKHFVLFLSIIVSVVDFCPLDAAHQGYHYPAQTTVRNQGRSYITYTIEKQNLIELPPIIEYRRNVLPRIVSVPHQHVNSYHYHTYFYQYRKPTAYVKQVAPVPVPKKPPVLLPSPLPISPPAPSPVKRVVLRPVVVTASQRVLSPAPQPVFRTASPRVLSPAPQPVFRTASQRVLLPAPRPVFQQIPQSVVSAIPHQNFVRTPQPVLTPAPLPILPRSSLSLSSLEAPSPSTDLVPPPVNSSSDFVKFS